MWNLPNIITLARILVAPSFLFRIEASAPGAEAQPVSDGELATRLSYFLWASTPDEQLLSAWATGQDHRDEGDHWPCCGQRADSNPRWTEWRRHFQPRKKKAGLERSQIRFGSTSRSGASEPTRQNFVRGPAGQQVKVASSGKSVAVDCLY